MAIWSENAGCMEIFFHYFNGKNQALPLDCSRLYEMRQYICSSALDFKSKRTFFEPFAQKKLDFQNSNKFEEKIYQLRKFENAVFKH